MVDYWDETYIGQLMATVEEKNSKVVVEIVKRKAQDKQEKKEEEDNKLTQRKKGTKPEKQKTQSHKLKQDYDPILCLGWSTVRSFFIETIGRQVSKVVFP